MAESKENTAEPVIPEILETKYIAQLLSVTPRTIQLLTKEGILHADGAKNSRHYHTFQTVQDYLDYKIDKSSNKVATSKDLARQKMMADINLKNLKAEETSLKIQELKGQLHRSEDVENFTVDLCIEIRSLLLSLPGMVSIELANMKDPAEISALLKNEVCNILETLTKYQYDPEKYRKRAYERHNIDLIDKELDEQIRN